MRRWVVAAVAALGFTGTGVTAGTLLLDEETSADAPVFSTTPLESFDTSTLTVARAGFCDAVDPRQVEAALGGEPAGASAYDNGDEVALTDAVSDVMSCTAPIKMHPNKIQITAGSQPKSNPAAIGPTIGPAAAIAEKCCENRYGAGIGM